MNVVLPDHAWAVLAQGRDLTHALLGFLLPAALPFATGQAGQPGYHDVSLLGAGFAAAALLAIASVVATGAGRTLKALVRAARTAHRTRNLTPQKIVGYKGPARRAEETPGLISRRIVERSEQIRRALAAEPSEVEVAMCAMGYAACAHDLLVLSRLVDERSPTADPIRRLAMRAAVRRAADSLARTRKVFPAHPRTAPFGADAHEGDP